MISSRRIRTSDAGKTAPEENQECDPAYDKREKALAAASAFCQNSSSEAVVIIAIRIGFSIR